MIKDQELLDSITNPKSNQKTNSSEIVRYDQNGVTDKGKKKKISDENACALEVSVGQNKFYKVRSKRGGQLFNPLKVGMVYNLNIIDRITNEPMFQFKEVTKGTFDAYVGFLEKRHDSLLTIAERESAHV